MQSSQSIAKNDFDSLIDKHFRIELGILAVAIAISVRVKIIALQLLLAPKKIFQGRGRSSCSGVDAIQTVRFQREIVAKILVTKAQTKPTRIAHGQAGLITRFTASLAPLVFAQHVRDRITGAALKGLRRQTSQSSDHSPLNGKQPVLPRLEHGAQEGGWTQREGKGALTDVTLVNVPYAHGVAAEDSTLA